MNSLRWKTHRLWGQDWVSMRRAKRSFVVMRGGAGRGRETHSFEFSNWARTAMIGDVEDWIIRGVVRGRVGGLKARGREVMSGVA